MPVGQGHKSWGSLKKEVTYGVDPGGARDGYFRIVPPESISVDKSYYQSPGSGTRIVRGMHEGVFVCGGDVSPEGNFEGGWLHFIRAALGAYGFQGGVPVVGTNTHTFTPAEDLAFSYAAEISKGDIPANQVFLYTGLMVDVMEFGIQQDALLAPRFTVICRNEVPGTARIAAPTYPTELPIKNVYYNPSYAPGLAVAVGSTVATLQQATARVSNRLERRPNLGQFTAQPIATDQRESMIEFTADFEDLVHYNKFLAETEGTALLVLVGPIITGTTRYTFSVTATTSHMVGGTPQIESLGLIRAAINLRLIKSTPELTVAIINNQATL